MLCPEIWRQPTTKSSPIFDYLRHSPDRQLYRLDHFGACSNFEAAIHYLQFDPTALYVEETEGTNTIFYHVTLNHSTVEAENEVLD